jgi:hypothetical protein
MSDLGETFCVQGIVLSVWWDDAQGASFVTFGREQGSFYMVLYGWYFTDLESGECVEATAEIGYLGNSPVMTIDAYDLLSCRP